MKLFHVKNVNLIFIYCLKKCPFKVSKRKIKNLSKTIHILNENITENLENSNILELVNQVNDFLDLLKEYKIFHGNDYRNSSQETLSTKISNQYSVNKSQTKQLVDSIITTTSKQNSFNEQSIKENEQKYSNIFIFENINSIVINEKIVFNSLFFHPDEKLLIEPKFYSCSVQQNNVEKSENDSTYVNFPMKEDMDTVNINDFQFIKKINQGSYGKIWLVLRKKTNDIYAIKIIDMLQKVK